MTTDHRPSTIGRLECFKAYDVRGRIPDQLDAEIAYRIARAYAAFLEPGRVALGHDIRLSSPELADAVARGLVDSGVEVLEIGCCGTEEIYFATSHLGLDGGICVTASHNPPDYNGIKLVRQGSRPISADTGLVEIRELAEAGDFPQASRAGERSSLDARPAYIQHLLGYVDADALSPLRIVVDAGNGGAGPVVDALEGSLPFSFVKLHHQPDGHFPNGVPNPMIEENRAVTAAAVRESGADLGIAWDGDFDRCFFFDETGAFVEGYYLVGLLGQHLLAGEPGGRVVHDPRLTWNTVERVAAAGGEAVLSRSGHAFMKDVMREHDAVYGGEMSAHHYFRDFAYCDSGMVPWLVVAEILSRSGQPLSALVAEMQSAYPVSGEINRRVEDAATVLEQAEARFAPGALSVDHTDGISVEFDDWRFNLRCSNTEPLVRLNVESRGDRALMETRRDELLALIGGEAG